MKMKNYLELAKEVLSELDQPIPSIKLIAMAELKPKLKFAAEAILYFNSPEAAEDGAGDAAKEALKNAGEYLVKMWN